MNEKSRLILSAYRPGGKDATDPIFAEALRQAEHDPSLSQWMRDSQNFDTLIALKLKSVEVPAGLRSAILAGAQAGEPKSPGWGRVLASRGFRRTALSLAAAAVVLAGLAILWQPGRREPEPWQLQSLAVLDGIMSEKLPFDLASNQPDELRRWLAAHGSPAAAQLPAALQGQPTLGCKSFLWNGHWMSVMCFHLASDQIVHLVTINRSGLAHPPPEFHPVYLEHGPWSMASWSDRDQSYMLIGAGGPREIRILLASARLRLKFSLLACVLSSANSRSSNL